MTTPELRARHSTAADVATASQPPPMPRESHDEIHLRLHAVEKALAKANEKLDAQERHRTRVETILGLVGACAIVVVIGALNLRDAVTRLEAGAATRESRITALETAGTRRDTDDRGTREAVVRLQTTVQALETTLVHRLDSIDARLAAQPAIHR